ncbi:uncharacterized protein [Diadema setosum]|uniref:uncharacterized protein n=1 Tax=Diadema setosum TaxID=31175 RepID=UPI003B3AC110
MSSLDCSEQVEVGEDGAILRIPDLQEDVDHVVFAHHRRAPLSNSHPAFRVKLVQLGKDAVVGLGISIDPIVVEEEDDEKESSHDHMSKDGIIYYSDDGVVTSPARKGHGDKSSKYAEGDVITFVVEQLTATKSLVCVLKNDAIQCRRWLTMKAEDLFPTVNAWWGPAELHVEWLATSGPSLSVTNLGCWLKSDDVAVEGEQLSLRDAKRGDVQSPLPLHKGSSMYFEAALVSLGDNDKEGPYIGLTTATWSPSSGKPGKQQGSISYNAAEGKILSSGETAKGKNLGATGQCQAGDVIGCGFILVEKDKEPSATQTGVAYFTKNRSVVHHFNVEQSIGGFFPSASFVGKGSSIRMIMNAAPPELPEQNDWVAAAQRAITFPGLGSFDFSINYDKSSKHEEGITKGNFRFSEPIGCPTSDTIRPQKDLEGEDGKLLQLLKTMTPSEPYFTVKILELDEDSKICVGVSREGQSCGSSPGSLVDSAGYASDGYILLGSEGYFKTEQFVKGDVVGVYIEFVDLTKVVQFVKNGQLMGQSVIRGSNKDIFPSLGFMGKASTVQATWHVSRPDLPPTYSKNKLENWLKSPEVHLDRGRFSMDKKYRRLKGKVILSPQPLSHTWSYFEVEVSCKMSTKAKKVLKAPIIGLTSMMTFSRYKDISKKKDVRDIRYFCHSNSVGYVDYLKKEMVPIKNYVQSGDRIGWGLIYPSAKNIPSDLARQVVIVYCCINGEVVYHKPMEQPGGGLYPLVNLYKYGEVVELLVNQTPPAFTSIASWIEEADEFRIEVDKQRKAAEFVLYLPYLMRPILPSKQKFRRGLHKQTAEERRARPATPAKRPDNHLRKYKVYIHCDPVRYNEATHIRARLDAKGFITELLPEDKLNSVNITPLIEGHISASTSVVCCMGPEISETQQMGLVLQLAQRCSKPVLPFILEKVKWPPAGELQNEWQKLVMHKIETSGDFDWAIQQIEEKTLNLKDKGYNGREIRVKEGKGAQMLYSDAQKGGKTVNEKSDPNALKTAMADADRYKLNKAFGSDDINGGGPSAGASGGRSLSFSDFQEPRSGFQEQERRRPASSRSNRGNNTSKACVIL